MGWGLVKRQRWEAQNRCCAVCGNFVDYEKCVGHHSGKMKSKGGQYTLDNCEVRCDRCEKIAHNIQPDGNPPYYLVLEDTDETQAEARGERTHRRSRKHRGQGRRSNHHRRR